MQYWESAITKWAKKTKQIPDELTPNMSMRLGTKLEAPILEIFTEEHPELTVYETGTWANKENPWARSNPDGLYQTEDGSWGIVEVQALSSLRRFYTDDAGYALAKRVDIDLVQLGRGVNGATIGTNDYATAAASTNAFIGSTGATVYNSSTSNAAALGEAGIRRSIQRLDDQDVPMRMAVRLGKLLVRKKNTRRKNETGSLQ